MPLQLRRLSTFYPPLLCKNLEKFNDISSLANLKGLRMSIQHASIYVEQQANNRQMWIRCKRSIKFTL